MGEWEHVCVRVAEWVSANMCVFVCVSKGEWNESEHECVYVSEGECVCGMKVSGRV